MPTAPLGLSLFSYRFILLCGPALGCRLPLKAELYLGGCVSPETNKAWSWSQLMRIGATAKHINRRKWVTSRTINVKRVFCRHYRQWLEYYSVP